MAQVIEDGLLACEDCAVAIANGDFTGMDDKTEARVKAGLEQLSTRGYAVTGEDCGFTWRGCDCCGASFGVN